jgi:mono/diheme cytochrome c family protein
MLGRKHLGSRERPARSRSSRWLALCGLVGFTVSVTTLRHTAYAQEIHAGGYAQQTGEALYTGLCQGCHMPDARGAVGAGAYPALANNVHLAASMYPITVVIHGQRAMPSFGADLSDEQIANVLNYVRTHFGNHYRDVVTPAAVQAARHASDPK